MFDPLLEEPYSFWFELRGGDVLDPRDGGQWFGPDFPKKFWRYFVKRNCLPFISWRFNKRGGYLGWKAYVADGEIYPQYRQWMPIEDTQQGSAALCLSARPFADMVKQ
jgi:hypothetical protein